MPWKKWRVSEDDALRVAEMVQEQIDAENDLVLDRWQRNLAEFRQPVDKKAVWKKMVHALVTTQQKSGPGTPVYKFIHENPFPLDYDAVRDKQDLSGFIVDTLTNRGILYYNRIAGFLVFNLDKLETDEWVVTLKKCNQLSGCKPTTKRRERDAARYIKETFKGFGSKQSRNLLQMLGLTRHEIPIDSRMKEWLLDFGYPPPLSGKLLADMEYYELVLDDVQALCKKADVPPCLFDAMVFKVKAGAKDDP